MEGVGIVICSVHTLGISGIQGSTVTAECYISNGLPGFDIVGLPDASVTVSWETFSPCTNTMSLLMEMSK